MKPENITLTSVPTERKEGVVRGQRGYPIDRAKLTELSESLRQDTMAEYVKRHPPA
jgi:hypothetical protein